MAGVTRTLAGRPDKPVVSNRPLDVIRRRRQITAMMRHMAERTIRLAPRALIDSLDASVLDLAAGRVGDASATQREARRMLEAFEKADAEGEAHAPTD
jgi:Flp pilus assembly protein CpaB